MTEIAKLFVTIGADASGLTKALENTKSALSSLGTGFGQLQNTASAAMTAMGLTATAMGGAVAAAGFQFNAMREQSEIAFTTMLGSGQAAQGMLDELQAFAAKTPFEFPDLVRASQRLMAMGFTAQEIIPTMTAVGDAVAALGGGQVEIDRVTTALGQMNAKGKTSAEEMMQLTEAGIPAWQMLADKIGVTVPEAMKMVTKGAVDARTTIGAVVAGINEQYGGMMEKQATTFNGLISNLKDNFTQLSGTVMKPFFDMVKTGLQQLVTITSSPEFTKGVKEFAAQGAKLAEQFAKFIESGIEWATRVLPPLWERLKQVGAAIQELIAPIAGAIGKFVTWKDALLAVGVIVVATAASIVASFAPVIGAFVAVTAAVSALRWAWENDFQGIRTYTLNTVQKISDWFYKESGIWKGTWEETGEYIADRIRYWLQYGIINFINLKILEIKNAFIHVKNIVTRTVDSWWQTVYDTTAGFINDTVAKFTNFKDRVISAWNKWIDPTKKDITDWVTVTKSKIEIWAGNLVNKFEDFKDKALQKFQPIFDWWERHIQPWINAGRDVVQGLWDGVREKWEQFNRWWQGVWNGSVKWVKDLLGIRSPSTLFEGYGENVMKGMALGVEKSQGLVTDALGTLPTQMTTALNISPDGNYAIPASNSLYADNSPQTDTTRIEQLLTVLINELRAKDMSVTVNNGGGTSYGSLVTHAAGMR